METRTDRNFECFSLLTNYLYLVEGRGVPQGEGRKRGRGLGKGGRWERKSTAWPPEGNQNTRRGIRRGRIRGEGSVQTTQGRIRLRDKDWTVVKSI